MNLLPQPRDLRMGTGDVDRAVCERQPEVRVDPSLPPEGYVLDLSPDQARIAAADDAGALYAKRSLRQLLRIHQDSVPACTIRDWPDLPVRAVMLDISRDKVPTLDTLKDLIDRLAEWKINQVQLYMEHTFAYRDHQDVWAESSPLSPVEVQELAAWCKRRHVDLVPNQNCFGHFDRWLKHDRYRPLAMSPDGWRNPAGVLKPPTTLDPAKPEALDLVQALLAEMVPCFGGDQVHVGLDEPWEMPAERYPEYLEWIKTLRRLPELDGKEMLMWGDIVALHPQSLEEIPAGVTVCEWGYEDWHMFDERASALAGAGKPFWLAPGTSSWLTILGRVDNMKGNCASAAQSALDHGATGYLNTDWGDMGHLQYLPVSEPGLAYGAAVSWCLDSNRQLDLADALSAHAFDDPSGEIGKALMELGNAHRRVAPQMVNMSILVMHLYFPQIQLGRKISEGLTVEDLEAVETTIDNAVQRLGRSRSRRPDASLVVEELRAGAALVTHMCHDARARLAVDGLLISIPEASRQKLAGDLDRIMQRHRQLWLERNRPGGLADSLKWLEHLNHCYQTATVDKYWGGW